MQSRYHGNLSLLNCNFIIQIVQYLAWTFDVGITFESNTTYENIRYINLYSARDEDNERSTGEYFYIFSSRQVSHQSKESTTVALFSTKVEYMTTTEV